MSSAPPASSVCKHDASSTPDGYTIGVGTSSTLALIAQNRASGLTNSNFTHVARVSTDPLMLPMPSTGTIKTLPGFIANMKANPARSLSGTPGNYNLNHVFASVCARAATAIDYVNIPYTGGSRVVADLIG